MLAEHRRLVEAPDGGVPPFSSEGPSHAYLGGRATMNYISRSVSAGSPVCLTTFSRPCQKKHGPEQPALVVSIPASEMEVTIERRISTVARRHRTGSGKRRLVDTEPAALGAEWHGSAGQGCCSDIPTECHLASRPSAAVSGISGRWRCGLG